MDSTGNALAADPNLLAGDSVVLTARGFTASETVTVTVHSTPETLTPATASTAGVVTYTYTVGSDLADGSHAVVFAGSTSGVSRTWTFTIGAASATPSASVLGEQISGTPASLPFTGSNIGRPVLFAVTALWSGFILLLLGRRRVVLEVPGGDPRPGVTGTTFAGARHRATGATRGRHRSVSRAVPRN
ncbi:MAG TPA: hypothetical protein VIJ96_06885 [Acidothermaceae bacterium]